MEYLLLLYDFCRIKKTALFLLILIPTALGVSIFHFADDANYLKNAADFRNNTVTVLGILIGFSISVFTVLLTIDNPHIRKAKEKKLNENKPKSISLYDSILVGLAYLIIVQGFLLIYNFVYPVFIPVDSCYGKILFSINLAITIHVILILMRSILDVYFILTKRI